VYQVQDQAASLVAVSEPVQQLQRPDRFVEDLFAPLRIGLRRAEIRERGHDLDLVPRQELAQSF